MGTWLDGVAKAMARATSRKDFLKLLGAAAVVPLVGRAGPAEASVADTPSKKPKRETCDFDTDCPDVCCKGFCCTGKETCLGHGQPGEQCCPNDRGCLDRNNAFQCCKSGEQCILGDGCCPKNRRCDLGGGAICCLPDQTCNKKIKRCTTCKIGKKCKFGGPPGQCGPSPWCICASSPKSGHKFVCQDNRV